MQQKVVSYNLKTDESKLKSSLVLKTNVVSMQDYVLQLGLDLPQVDLMNFRVEYVRPRSGRCLGREAAERATKSFVRRVLNKQGEELFRKSKLGHAN